MNMKWDKDRLRQIVDAAQGRIPADLCVRNSRIVNVITGRIETQDVAIHRGFIVGWGDYEAKQNVEAEGMYACPGFIDGHVHMESSLLSPTQFSAAVVPWGTSAVVADPHEIANVLGLGGIRYFLDATRDLPVDVFFNLPSCVPASPLESSGAQLKALDLFALLPHERLIGLAEMMNFPGVLFNSEDVADKILLFQESTLDGHAPMLSGLGLNAYLAAGIGSDHECTSFEEAKEKLAKGMNIMIREGSQSKDLEALLPVVDGHTWPRCMFVSDDRHPDDLLKEGHMNAIVNKAMTLGMDPVLALTLATWTPARYFRLTRRGAIAPGYFADFSLSPTLNPWTPQRVFKGGVEVARNGSLLFDPNSLHAPPPPLNPMRITRTNIEDLKVISQPGSLRVIGVQEGTLFTKKLLFDPKVENGFVTADTDRDILKLAVYNRYAPDRPPSVGFVHGLGLSAGAIATTIAHDSHNLLAVGTNDEAILRAVNSVITAGGGMAIGGVNDVMEILPLPIAGLMSDEPLERVVQSLEALKLQARAMGCRLHNPFMALSFLALPVIPELKLTDLGLVDVSTFSFVPLFETS